MVENRTVLFMYPDLGDVDAKEQNTIIRIISDLKLIISESNRQIGKILQEEANFSYIRCLPIIGMEEANKQPTEENIDFVRVCVIGYDHKNYEESYKEICSQYEKNKLNISHLIGVKIDSQSTSVKFSKPDNSPFDVIVESNFDSLVAILISIMLDTSLYHYFSLNNDIAYRKNFSNIKMEGIKKELKEEDYDEISNLENIRYLPLSYPYIKKYLKLSKKNTETSKESVINDLINYYFEFVKNYACYHLEYNHIKEANKPYAQVKANIKKALQTIIDESFFQPNNSYIVAIKNDISVAQGLQINSNYFVVAENNDVIKNWLRTFVKPLNNCSMFHIKIGD